MNLILTYIKRQIINLRIRIIQGYHAYIRKLYLNNEQRKETSKILLRVCEVIVIALIARPFIPGLEKVLTIKDNMYGILLLLFLYLGAMKLLKGSK